MRSVCGLCGKFSSYEGFKYGHFCEECYNKLKSKPLWNGHVPIKETAKIMDKNCARCVDRFYTVQGAAAPHYCEFCIPIIKHSLEIQGQEKIDAGKDKPNLDDINSPKHYTSHPSGVECIQITRHFPFAVGNTIKYLWREGLKESNKEDALKAHWYLQDWLMKHHGCTVEELMPRDHK
jgi:hypothetical protein